MRFPDEKIKAALLHPEAEVRLTALRYFAESHSDDASIMPFVIEAIEKYGLNDAFDLLRSADHLRQTPATVDWLIAQLRRDFDVQDMDQDNLRFALALALVNAEPELLARRHTEIISLAAFPEQLKRPLSDILKLDFSNWPKLWSQLEETGRKAMANNRATVADNRRLHRIVTAMARRRDDGADKVLSLLHRQHRDCDKSFMVWLEPMIVELAGRMKLESAIPLLLERLDEDYEAVQEVIGTALVRIGGDTVIEAVRDKWERLDTDRRLFLTAPLERIRSDLAMETVLSFLRRAKDTELRSALAYAALGQFAAETVEPVRNIFLNDGEGGDYWDLRYRLVATTTILGETFREFGDWHHEAVVTNYGFEKIKDRLEPHRLADSFREDDATTLRIAMLPKRIQIIPNLHGKITRDGKVSEPDIYDIVEKWLERHQQIKLRQRDIRISRGHFTLPQGVRTDLVDVSLAWGEDIDGYDPSEDADLYKYFLADDQGEES